VKVRIVGVLAVLALAASLLSACRTNVGVAARVDGHKISENTVDDYAGHGKALASSDGSSIGPRAVALYYLVEQRVVNALLDAAPGATPSAATIDSAVSSAVAQSGGSAAVVKQLGLTGYPTKLTNVAIRDAVIRIKLDEVANLSTSDNNPSLSDIATALKFDTTKFPVTVSSRFGEWNASALTVDLSGGQPPYLTLQSTAAAQPAS